LISAILRGRVYYVALTTGQHERKQKTNINGCRKSQNIFFPLLFIFIFAKMKPMRSAILSLLLSVPFLAQAQFKNVKIADLPAD